MKKSAKYTCITALFLFVITAPVIAQNASTNERYVLWQDDAGWSFGDSPVTNLIGDDVLVRGSVQRNGNLSVNSAGLFSPGSTLIIDEQDTLVVNGNLNIGLNSELIVRDEAILVVFGNLTGAEFLVFAGSEVGNEGTVIVTGDASFSNFADNENDGDLYVFGDTNGNISGNPPLGEDDLPLNLEDFINDGAPLPIELKQFTVEKDRNTIHLNWITAKEENFSHFEIERLVYEEQFELVSIIQGAGNSLSDIAYEYIDSEAPYGLLYYRLKAVDIDGTFEYSDVLEIKNGYESKLAVFPNPTHSITQLKLVFPEDFSEKISSLMLYSTSGELLLKSSNIDIQQQSAIFNEEVKSGLYLLKIQHNGIEENVRVIVR